MIAEIIPEAYDAEGRKVSRPFGRHKGLRPTFPLGRYVSQPLAIQCHSIKDVRNFLSKCKYVSDKELFGRDEYWQPPDQFEEIKKGDCEDFAFWTWRQLMAMGYEARVVFGRHGRYGEGHAWVEFLRDGTWFLLEPLAWPFGERLPRLNTLRYHPRFSISWNEEKISYFAHEERSYQPSVRDLAILAPEYVALWGKLWLLAIPKIPLMLWRLLKRLSKGIRWRAGTADE